MTDTLITIILFCATVVIVFGSTCSIIFLYVLLRDFICEELL